MLSDGHWAVLEPRVEVCRPNAQTPFQDLKRTLSAILWRDQNGAKWRAIPQDLRPWGRAAQILIPGPVATRYEKTAAGLGGILCLTAALDHLGCRQTLVEALDAAVRSLVIVDLGIDVDPPIASLSVNLASVSGNASASSARSDRAKRLPGPEPSAPPVPS
ncbi:transposase [Methylobacterium sp. P1-11]|nr:transposase [Methylobacterium sp. P1-11]